MSIFDPATIASVTTAVGEAEEAADEIREGVVAALRIGGTTWTVVRPQGGVSSPMTYQDPAPAPVTLDVVKASSLGLADALAGTLAPTAKWLAFGDDGQDLETFDVITSVDEPTMRMRVLTIDPRNGRIVCILTTPR